MKADLKMLKKNLLKPINHKKLSICMNINKIGIQLCQLLDNIIQKVSTKSSLIKLNSILKEEILLKPNKLISMPKNQRKLSTCIKKLECMEKLLELPISMLLILCIQLMRTILEDQVFKVNQLKRF